MSQLTSKTPIVDSGSVKELQQIINGLKAEIKEKDVVLSLRNNEITKARDYIKEV